MTTAGRRARTRATEKRTEPRLVLVGGAEPIRTKRIDAVRDRIRNGYYERNDIRESLARAVLDALRNDD